ncbi:MAG: hypothetical protein D6732_22750 [Methanobacteriota archaeon]|nr:MAG: hypothetical protein D6732_22750 [Euryarchaeota archaeon]
MRVLRRNCIVENAKKNSAVNNIREMNGNKQIFIFVKEKTGRIFLISSFPSLANVNLFCYEKNMKKKNCNKIINSVTSNYFDILIAINSDANWNKKIRKNDFIVL